MAYPAGRASTAWSIDRAARLLALALALSAQPLHAQVRPTDPGLEALIPDSAVARPEDWAKAPPPADAVQDEQPAPVPTSPLAELPGLTLPWPDEAPPLPALVSLESEPGLAGTDPADGLPPAPAEGAVTRLDARLSLVFPADPAAFPDRAALEARFRALSALVTLARGDEDNLGQIAVRARTDRELLVRLLRIYGHYDADVMQTVGGVEPGQERAIAAVTVRFDVVPGARYRLGTIALGNLAETRQYFPLLRGRFGVWPGDPLNSDAIVAAQAELDTALADNGYAFAATGEPDLLIDHRREEGDLTLPVATGGKYRFGALTSSLGRFLPASHLQRIARFRPSEVYSRAQVDDLRRAILATGLVASVAVTPRETAPPRAGEPGEVALDIAMTKAPLRTIAGAAGYESGDGARVEVSWEHRNLLPPEGMLRLRGILGTKEQLVGTTLRFNNFRGRDQVLTADLYANNVTRTAYEARTVALIATFEKLTTLIFQKPWIWSLGAELLATEEREGAVGGVNTARETYFIGALPLRAAYDASDDLLDPTRGWRASLRVSPELSVQQGNRSTYARVQADASAYLPIGKAAVLAGRVRLGTIPGTAIANIAPSRRFYAGGGGSVRGYGYQLIGPRDSLGDPSGGRSLTEVSLEARIGTGLFDGALSVVPFIDAGSVDESAKPGWRDMRYGIGIGVRYKTGFGPIRIDVGTPLNRRDGESRIGVTVALGQAF